MVHYYLVLVHLVCQWSPWCKQILVNKEMLLCSFFAWGSQKKSPGNAATLDMMGKSRKSSWNEGIWVLSEAWLIWVPRHVFDIWHCLGICNHPILLDQSCWTIKHAKQQTHKKLQHSVIILSTTSELSPQEIHEIIVSFWSSTWHPHPKKMDEHYTYHRPPLQQPNSNRKKHVKKQFHQKKTLVFTGYTGFDPFLVRPEMPVLPLKKSDPSLGPETSWLQVPRRWPRCNNWWQKPKKKMKPKYYLYNLIYVICKLSGAIRNIFIIYTQLYYMYQYSLKDGSNCLFWKVGLELLSFFMKLLSLDMSFHFDGG